MSPSLPPMAKVLVRKTARTAPPLSALRQAPGAFRGRWTVAVVPSPGQLSSHR